MYLRISKSVSLRSTYASLCPVDLGEKARKKTKVSHQNIEVKLQQDNPKTEDTVMRREVLVQEETAERNPAEPPPQRAQEQDSGTVRSHDSDSQSEKQLLQNSKSKVNGWLGSLVKRPVFH